MIFSMELNNWVWYHSTKVHGFPRDDIKVAHKKPNAVGGAPKREILGDSPQTNDKLIMQEPSKDFQEFVRNMKENVLVGKMHGILCENGQDVFDLDHSMIEKWYNVRFLAL